MKTFFSLYTLKLPKYFVYMLQQVEYNPKFFISWVQELFDNNRRINTVMHRKQLVSTTKARSLVIVQYLIIVLILVSLIAVFQNTTTLLLLNLIIILLALPYIIFLSLVIIIYFSYWFIVQPQQSKLLRSAERIFYEHKGIKIAVIGSYGKTTMKELLLAVLSESKIVSATPGNMNTAVSQARFAKSLSGNEDVLIVEFGEGEPGDVALMSKILKPDYAVITGLAPNHLDKYPSLKSLAKDLLSVSRYVDDNKIFITDESRLLQPYLEDNYEKYNSKSVMGWKISNCIISVTKTEFTMKKNKKILHISTGLIGRHQVAPTAVVAAFADQLGLAKTDIESGFAKVVAHEHRMQPRQFHGAWLIDDTYNGNIEGMKAGLRLLGELDMKRKWYVTPGLVDQGAETENVHTELGQMIADISPDIVVLMDNSARPIIQKSMESNGFGGELRIEKNPLEFYTNIEHIIVSGDLVLMQNDWTDNYN